MARTRTRTGEAPGRDEEWLTTVDAGQYVKLAPSYLDKLRHTGGGPPFIRIGEGNGRNVRIRYRRADLDVWMMERREHGGAACS